mmetsp:Transcript_49223/g.158903  ORF Transcript_49223/g.158903 Transcript_49223/m.158903 type:complete len:393 (+) Transcript_49223:103-1281(+)
MEPASSLEVLTVLAGRWGGAYRSARRDLHRLASSEDFPEVFALAARALQELGLVLRPTHRGALQHARKDVRDLVEVLVQIADTFGTLAGAGAASSSPAVAQPIPPHTDPVFVQDPWASASASKTSRSSQSSSGAWVRAVTGVVREALPPSDPWARWASARSSLPSPQPPMGLCGDVPAEACETMGPPCSSPTTGSPQVLAVVGSVADVVSFARASGFGHGIPPALEGLFAGGLANAVDEPRRLDCESLDGRAPTSTSAPRSAAVCAETQTEDDAQDEVLDVAIGAGVSGREALCCEGVSEEAEGLPPLMPQRRRYPVAFDPDLDGPIVDMDVRPMTDDLGDLRGDLKHRLRDLRLHRARERGRLEVYIHVEGHPKHFFDLAESVKGMLMVAL